MATKQAITNLVVKDASGNTISSSTKNSGDKELKFSASANTGRHARQSTLTLKIDGTTTKKTVTINQSGAGMRLSSQDNSIAQNTASRSVSFYITTNAKTLKIVPYTVGTDGTKTEGTPASSAGKTLEIQGYVNNKTVLDGENVPKGTMASTIEVSGATVDGVLTANGATPSSDVGATAEFGCYYNITIPKNTTAQDAVYYFKVTAIGDDVDGNTITPKSIDLQITSGAGDKFLYISTTSGATTDVLTYTIPASGTAITAHVNSNTTWTIG